MEVFVLQVASAKVWENKIALSKPPHSEHRFSVLFNTLITYGISIYVAWLSHQSAMSPRWTHPHLHCQRQTTARFFFLQKTPTNASTLGISHETQRTIAWPLALCAICWSKLDFVLFPYDSRCLVWGCIFLFISSDLHCPMVFWAHQVALQHPVEKPEVIGHSFRRLPSLAVVN